MMTSKTIRMSTKKELRHFQPELRAEEGKPEKGFGYFVRFNSETELWPGFREKIAPGALDDVMDADVRVLVNHDSNLIVARTKAGTARLSQDAIGGMIEWDFPDTTAGRDLKENMRLKLIDGMSFGFTIKSEEMTKNPDGSRTRTITKLGKLYDASPVVFPAYEASIAELRSEMELSEQPTAEQIEEQRMAEVTDHHRKLRVKIFASMAII